MRKIALLVVAALFTLAANAQFEQGKCYVGAALSSVDFSYNGNGVNLGVNAQAGYTIMDNIMLLGEASFQHRGKDDLPNTLSIGGGGRYYIEQNGIYLGLKCKYVHANKNYNDVMPGVEIGYAFFLNGSVTIEPSVTYDQSFKDQDYSTVGFHIGLGYYF